MDENIEGIINMIWKLPAGLLLLALLIWKIRASVKGDREEYDGSDLHKQVNKLQREAAGGDDGEE